MLGLAPVTAPVLGGAVLSVGSWRAVFVVLAIIGVLLFLAALFGVSESLPLERRQQGGVVTGFRAMGRLLGHRAFVGCMLAQAFSAAALFSYIAGSSFVFENLYGVSATRCSLIFATNAAGMVLAGRTFGALSKRLPVGGLLAAGAAVALAGTSAMLCAVLALAFLSRPLRTHGALPWERGATDS
ncbi:MFS transporter [Streptomyces sp. NBC_00076]|uniref:MFS transporter n=1 Tax=Streptomyces sp. NBC_00076 TaxID=2975642 RepID=UPI0032499DED